MFFLRKKVGALLMMILLAGVIFVCGKAGRAVWEGPGRDGGIETAADLPEDSGLLVILDPGHGGMDGGKTGVNGAEEKTINLQISLEIKGILEEAGVSVELTREGDDRLADTQAEDLKKRVSIMNSRKPVLAVSIHQNSYHEEDVSGAQVFYYTDSSEGKRAAEILQEYLKKAVPENTKEAKANSAYYILKKTEVPVVIVECGFLSNREEAENLTDQAYQKKIAEAAAQGILDYIGAAAPLFSS